MSDLSEFFDAYESGQIGAVDLYEQLPTEMRKSVDEMLKAKPRAAISQEVKKPSHSSIETPETIAAAKRADEIKRFRASMMKLSVDEGKEEEKKKDDEEPKENEARDLIYEDKEDLDKQMTAAPAQAQRATPVSTAASNVPPTSMSASLGKSLKAQENQTASRYGIETVRKSFVGHSCTHCQRLHKSVGKVCDECRKSMNSTVWHSGSHLE
jgi:hypothetical protein